MICIVHIISAEQYARHITIHCLVIWVDVTYLHWIWNDIIHFCIRLSFDGSHDQVQSLFIDYFLSVRSHHNGITQNPNMCHPDVV